MQLATFPFDVADRGRRAVRTVAPQRQSGHGPVARWRGTGVGRQGTGVGRQATALAEVADLPALRRLVRQSRAAARARDGGPRAAGGARRPHVHGVRQDVPRAALPAPAHGEARRGTLRVCQLRSTIALGERHDSAPQEVHGGAVATGTPGRVDRVGARRNYGWSSEEVGDGSGLTSAHL